ncbi:probable TRS130 TRAPP subunit of 130 kDa involved in targeting and fusion of ER to golgi transport vesicles [Rhynchosporium agropyri]|uniref:Probable TRS130 TRAPP subunit of 130 kDa involved in targeting and fusion of ER to golgi transport vesicles n=1 Tax=Rhynchosporium agropyri TaxID=914238 RepID=A0A1E1KJZ9_9HELO|nr:probable TRS130 TRAPP subunit of 130 kDa involved in targeting and fusion of ER to golgi transport vesicles [Rhynchosporium agropyri]
MEQPSSSSKVTVEYFDPHGVFQLLSPGLLPRLPLRNLHWESHAGPLRSISSLHVDLVPSIQSPPLFITSENTSASTSGLSGVKSQESIASGDDGFRTQALGQAAIERPESSSGPPKLLTKERRHQIPGLRQTPYLKVFFLRCDDNDTYKAQARRQVREWIKENTPTTQTSSKVTAQENHDAYEWLIVHVIVPNTAAATQPRTSGKSGEGSSGSTSEKSTARWRGGGSSTILEKLRADFNGSSKSGVDRIAQIRIGINDVPYDMLPRVVPAIPGSYTETPQENENAWLDLIAKLKFQILTSFDMRVTQYEEDIREKDTQRLLPGWNFCTFFVLKEGLARGFESVGLIEDALVGYDELAVGLDMIVREQSITGSGAQHGGSFLPFTEDLKQKARNARRALLRDTGTEEDVESDDPIDMQSVSAASDPEWDEIPLNATRKRYRDLILSNDISIFDFRCYIFARQLALLLRLANASSSQEELLAKLKEQRESNLQGVAARNPASQPSEETENLSVLGEICRRSMDFMASISQIMRDDIWQSCKADDQTGEDGLSALPNPVMNQVINNMVSSFTFSISQQILAQTSTKALPIPPSTLASPSGAPGADGQEPKATIPEPKTMMHPARSSSLALRSRSREPPSPGIFPGMRGSSVPEQGTAASPFLKAGLEDLAGHRADLYLLSRSVLIQVGKEHKWSVGWEEVKHLGEGDNGEMEDVDLSQEVSGNRETVALAPSLYGIVNKLLRTAIEDKDDFYRLYETLTDKALRHYTVANHIHSVQACMADLAVLKYHLGNVAAAASYFYRMTPFYGESGWAEVELSMLVVYASCLKKLSRKEEYVKVVLKLLSKTGLVERAKLYNKTILKIGRSSVHSETLPAESYIPELLEITKGLQHEVRIPLESFFGNIEVDGTLRYQPGKDSFEIEIRLQYLLMENLPIEKAKVRITSSTGDVGREIWLESSKPIVFKRGKNTVSVQSNVNVPGTYLVKNIILETNNIFMEYDHSTTGLSSPKDGRVLKCPKLLVYQRLEAFDIKLFASRYMHLDQNRSLEIALSSGWNQVQSGELHVRSATAGLRVVTSEAKIGNGSLELSKISEAGVVHFGAMEPYSNARIVMPFSLEHDVNDISLKLEISYTTEEGTFFFATTPSVSIMLPLGVNVQDFFKHKALFSKFTISSATSSPLRLLGSKLEDSEVFEAHSGLTLSKPLVIFPRQPATMLYKITKSPSGSVASKIARPSSRKGSKSVLSLVLNYICVEEEIEDAVTLSLENLLGKSSLIQYSRLIIPTFLTQVRMRLSPYDLERSAILGELHTSNLANIKWGDHFAGLGRSEEHNQEVSILIEESLQQWIQQTPSIPLAPIFLTDDTLDKSRSIVIPVDVPSVSVVCTADLKFLELSSLSSDPILAASNQPLSATLTIKYTRIWNTAPEPEHDASTADDSLEFFYEVSAASDIWLIGGKRKGHFRIPRKASPEDSKRKITFPIVLIPLREGFVPFPHVDIKSTPRLHSSGENSGNPAKKVDVVSCETDYKNAGETVRVITDALNTTVSLDASGPQGGAWLLESERRGWESVEAVPSERQ